MAARDHASLVTHRNYNLVRTTVINSSQRRTCATMLALTSHYMATNAKHPRYARRSFGRLATHCNRRGATGGEKRFAAIHWLRSVGAWLALGLPLACPWLARAADAGRGCGRAGSRLWSARGRGSRIRCHSCHSVRDRVTLAPPPGGISALNDPRGPPRLVPPGLA